MANTKKQKPTPKKETTLQNKIKKTSTKKSNSTKTSTKIQDTISTELLVPKEVTTSKASLSSFIQEPSWSANLQDLFKSSNFQRIEEFLNAAWSTGKVSYPPNNLIFEAFNKTPFDKVKVVLLGQDPYHDDGQVNAEINFKDNFLSNYFFLGSWSSFFCTCNSSKITTIIKEYL